MKILNNPPANYFMPGEFSNHDGCLMIWPERRDSWSYGGYKARIAFIKIAKYIAMSEKLTVFTSYEGYNEARHNLPENIRVVEMSSDDAWARDTAPTFLINKNGGRIGIDWGFNAWGGLYDGLYFPWDKDNSMARKICDLFDIDCLNMRKFIMEGGAIESNGNGVILVTDECIESAGRNPDLSRTQKDEILKSATGAQKILRLPYGIYNDETNGHIDNICRFADEKSLILATCDDKSDPQYKRTVKNLEYLESICDLNGEKFNIIKLPLPPPVLVSKEDCEGLDMNGDEPSRTVGERLAASYCNFYISNDALIFPNFGDKNDEIAGNILSDCFKGRKILPFDARDILLGGGNIHCLTQQIPSII